MANGRDVIWRRTMDDLSFEQARLGHGSDGPELSGTVLIAERRAPLRVDYRLACDGGWRTRTVRVTETYAGATTALRLDHDGRGRWWRDGREAPALAGCTDVDLGVSPSTNALPINRLRLAVGASATIRAAWVRFPGLVVEPMEQAYERLAASRYRYRSLASGFEAVLDVDDDGLPTTYSGVWRRIADGPTPPGDQPAADPASGFADALLAAGPAPDLGGAADDFGWLVGGWRAEVRDIDRDGTVRTGRGEWWFAWVLEGRAMQDVWISPPRGERSQPRPRSAAADRYGTTIRRFDRAAAVWRITWINPVSGAIDHLAGERAGDRIVLLGAADGRPLRWSFNEIRDNRFVWVGESGDGRGGWTTEAEFRLHRIGRGEPLA